MGALAGAMPAVGADIGAHVPYKAAPVIPAYDWSGFYLGVNAGYSVMRDRSSFGGFLVGVTETFATQSSGWLGGGQAGYNWQTAHLLIGIEADIQARGQRGTACILACIDGVIAGTLTQEIPWLATVRGRLGYTDGGTLYYATGGLAYGRVKTTMGLLNAPGADARVFETNKAGWTIGGGVETSLGGAWSAKVEYLYVDLGSTSNSFDFLNFPGATQTATSSLRDHMFRAGLNYGFGQRAMAAATMPSATRLRDWTGWYAGANAGYGIARNATSYIGTGFQPSAETFSVDPAGFVGGGQIGYNWQTANVLFGVEADFQGATGTSSANCLKICSQFSFLSVSEKLDWFGTLRGRVGFATGSAMIYGTGGLAFGHASMDINSFNATLLGTSVTQTVSASATKAGWTAGGGIESAIDDHWSVKAEYLYVDLGSIGTSFVTDFGLGSIGNRTVSSDVREHIARVGFNYRLGSR